jgi:hypothetical protein
MIKTKEIEPSNEATTGLEEEGARVKIIFSANCEKVINVYFFCKQKLVNW